MSLVQLPNLLHIVLQNILKSIPFKSFSTWKNVLHIRWLNQWHILISNVKQGATILWMYMFKIKTQTLRRREETYNFHWWWYYLVAVLPILEVHVFHTLLGTSSGSAPTFEFSGRTSMSHSIRWGIPDWPIRISNQSHDSCISACRK